MNFVIYALIAVICLFLSGCDTLPRVTPVNVAVPIKCKATVPVRPIMPTEILARTANSFEIARAALAEIDIRDAYEDKLVFELKSCL